CNRMFLSFSLQCQALQRLLLQITRLRRRMMITNKAAFIFVLALFLPEFICQPQHEPITYAHHYPDADARPNVCKIAHSTNTRDSQLLVLRLFYSSLGFPIKHFVVVVPERALSPPRGGMWYELEHLKDYAENVVIITCTNPPSVAEGWNAVFQAFPDEPWGVYCARDTAWTPGSLQKLAGHMWGATKDNSLEIALMRW
ncbi:hypothetical protein COO60DRAFT_1545930, partial [Scenedesmus sp. NREL 46B-D3]